MMTSEEYLRARCWGSQIRLVVAGADSPTITIWCSPVGDRVEDMSQAVDIQVKRDRDCTEFAMHHKFAARSGG